MARKMENGEPKLNIREENGKFYASTSTSRMVNGRKITETVYLGRYDPATGTVIPKKTRGKQRPREEIEVGKEEMDVRDLLKGLNSKEYGSVHLLDQVQRRSALGADLHMAFGPRVGAAILGTAMALCIHRGSFQSVGDTMERTLIREAYGLKAVYDSEHLSEFTHSIGLAGGNMDSFFESRVAFCGDVVSWDTTTIGTFSTSNCLAQYLRNNKDNEDIPQVKKAIASDRRGVPVLFETYPGTMSDMATLEQFVDRIHRYKEKAKAKGVSEEVTLVMDRGFGSGANIHYMIVTGMRFVTPANMETKGVKTMIARFKNRRNERLIFDDHAYDVWSTEMAVVESGRRNTDGSPAYDIVPVDEAPEDAAHVAAFVCFDTKKRSDEIQSLSLMIHNISRRLDEVDSSDPMGEFKKIAGKASKYFEVTADGRRLSYRVRTNAVSFAENRAGIFFMLATDGMRWEEMMACYDVRRLVEQNFDRDKNGWGRFGSGDVVTIQGREFIRFVSLIMTCELGAMIREAGVRELPDNAVNSAGAISAIGRDGVWEVKNMVKRHRTMFENLGIPIPEEVVLDMPIATQEQLDLRNLD